MLIYEVSCLVVYGSASKLIGDMLSTESSGLESISVLRICKAKTENPVRKAVAL